MYLVGGAVRDELRGVVPNDYDYVIVGSDHQSMQRLGYIRIHSTLPVYRHPDNPGCQFTLAYTKAIPDIGVWQFDRFETKSVTIEEDLANRDLTINAMAKCVETGKIIDPFGGVQDIRDRILRPVSDKIFIHDPVRAYRMAKFLSLWEDWHLWTEDPMVFEKMSSVPVSSNWDAITKITLAVLESGGDFQKYSTTVGNLVPFFYDRTSDNNDLFSDNFIDINSANDLIRDQDAHMLLRVALLKITNPSLLPGAGHRVTKNADLMMFFIIMLTFYDTDIVNYKDVNCIQKYTIQPKTSMYELVRYFIASTNPKEKSLLLSSAQTIIPVLRRSHSPQGVDHTGITLFLKKINELIDSWASFKRSIDFEILETSASIRGVPLRVVIEEEEEKYIFGKMGA